MMKTEGITSSNSTENAILAAAEREFLTKGFAGARTTSIAEAAGVTHAMLHYYFRTKAKLFDRIIEEKISLLKEALFNPVENENASIEETIQTIIERHLDFIAANPDLPRFITSEVYSNTERSDVFLSQITKYAPIMLNNLQSKIDRAAEARHCRRVDARMLILDITSLNIFSFIAAPILNAAMSGLTADFEKFIAMRKKENFDTIMRKLKP